MPKTDTSIPSFARKESDFDLVNEHTGLAGPPQKKNDFDFFFGERM
jgi:hypothetical protein